MYELIFDVEHYRLLVPVDENDLDGDNLWISGKLKLSSWQAPVMRYAEKAAEHEEVADITQITPGFFAYSQKAVDALGFILKEYGELLPFEVDGQPLYAFNPHNEIDCLDQENSEWRIKRDGTKGRLISAKIDVEKTNNATILQVPEFLKSKVFVSEAFKKAIVEKGISGLAFKPC